MQFVFDERKAAQAAAKLLQLRGGTMPYIKLMNLLYLANRQSLLEIGYPITGDRLVSLDRGPILSKVLDFITWGDFDANSAWPEYVSPKNGYDVSLNAEIERDFDHLSEYEIGVLTEVDARFGHLEWRVLVKFTHELPEWIDPHGSSIDIDVRTILESAGKSAAEVEEVASQVESIWTFKSAYAAVS
ncbi:MAG: DUF4065 domain-containing protein [Chloroflexi bacterium]|nr:MAG: DUF4065 domain-containing protein [Chloroflexota bacterium]